MPLDLPEGPTLGDALARYGYGHRPSKIEGKREVYRLSDGEIAGTFDALEAWEFLSGERVPRAHLSPTTN